MFMSVGGTSVHLQVQGPPQAPVLLMLHSLGTGLHVWDPQAEALSRSYRVVRFDMRGHGLTATVPGEATMAALAGDAFGVMDALGVRQVHVAGISIGGRIAMEMAASQPDRVSSLFLLATAMEFPPPSGWQARIEAVTTGGMKAVADAVMARWVVDQAQPSAQGLRAMLLATPPQGYAAACAALRDARAEPLVQRLRCRATVVVGEFDQASPVPAAEAIRDAIPDAALSVLPGVAHIPTYEAADDITDALRRHVDEALTDDPR